MSQLVERAQQIFSAAETAVNRGEPCTRFTMLINPNGQIHMLSDSDWPLDSLLAHHGAQSVFRVSQTSGMVRVEAQEGRRRCLLESPSLPNTARFLQHL